MRKQFSGVGQFRTGQFVSVNGVTGIAVGWKHGRFGKMVAVRITATKSRWKKGTVVFAYPAHVAARKGNAGSAFLTPFTVPVTEVTIVATMTAVGRSFAA